MFFAPSFFEFKMNFPHDWEYRQFAPVGLFALDGKGFEIVCRCKPYEKAPNPSCLASLHWSTKGWLR